MPHFEKLNFIGNSRSEHFVYCCWPVRVASKCLETDVTVVHISGGPDGATIVREVARVHLVSCNDQFALCERGRSYLLRDYHRDALQLFDVATGHLKCTFPRRACPPDCAVGFALGQVLAARPIGTRDGIERQSRVAKWRRKSWQGAVEAGVTNQNWLENARFSVK